MILERNEYFAEPFDIDMSGINLVADGNDLLVDDVEEKSAAAAAGVEGGDILVAVNGRPVTDLTLDQIRRMFMQDGAEHLLSVKREREVLHLKMRLRRIV
jgi:S1-C subfamily serine protease